MQLQGLSPKEDRKMPSAKLIEERTRRVSSQVKATLIAGACALGVIAALDITERDREAREEASRPFVCDEHGVIRTDREQGDRLLRAMKANANLRTFRQRAELGETWMRADVLVKAEGCA